MAAAAGRASAADLLGRRWTARERLKDEAADGAETYVQAAFDYFPAGLNRRAPHSRAESFKSRRAMLIFFAGSSAVIASCPSPDKAPSAIYLSIHVLYATYSRIHHVSPSITRQVAFISFDAVSERKVVPLSGSLAAFSPKPNPSPSYGNRTAPSSLFRTFLCSPAPSLPPPPPRTLASFFG